MTQLIHDDSLEWPNGKGFTPCTSEYRRLFDEQMAIFDPTVDDYTTEDLSSEDYNRWHLLQHKLDNLQLNGHLLPGERI